MIALAIGCVIGYLVLQIGKFWTWTKLQPDSPTAEKFSDWQRRVRGY